MASSPAQLTKGMTISFAVMAFVANYCQNCDKDLWLSGVDEHPYEPGFRLIKSFIDPDVSLHHIHVRRVADPDDPSRAGKQVAELVLQYLTRHLALEIQEENSFASASFVHPGIVRQRVRGAIRGSLRRGYGGSS